MKTLIVYYSLEGNTEYAVNKIAEACGYKTVGKEVTTKEELIAAILDAMPKPSGNEKNPTKAFHEGHQRALFCDIMGRSEREYWSSTNREIADKIDCYLEVKGEKEAPTLVRRYGEMKQGSETI